ncbi:MAG: hypothetical protein RBT87_02775 [bacterium]|jgi:hypothetical protein|nr:hypothetical protein [bacterium]
MLYKFTVVFAVFLIVGCSDDFQSVEMSECHNEHGVVVKTSNLETVDEEVEIPDSDNEILGDEKCLKIEVVEHSQNTISFNYDGLFDCGTDVEYGYTYKVDEEKKEIVLTVTSHDTDPNQFSYCMCCKTMPVKIESDSADLEEFGKIIINIYDIPQEYSIK